MARGNVLSRFGDVYGPVVNIASRLTSAAKPGTVLVDRELATALAERARAAAAPAPTDLGAGLQQPVVVAPDPDAGGRARLTARRRSPERSSSFSTHA